MCGRFAFYSSAQQVRRQFDIQFSLDFEPRYNICPGQSISAFAYDSGTVKAKNVGWGFEPKWGDTKTKLIINARAETVHEKNTFKTAFKKRRCVIFANGWFEWLKKGNEKQPYYFSRSDLRLLAFAGILSTPKDDESQSAIILTRDAPSALAFVHPRSPLLLTRKQISSWLSDVPFSFVSQTAIDEFDTQTLSCYQVSNKVNNVRNDNEDLISKYYGF
jgi:putative SOS response-associated peptidase YedK